MFDRMYLASSKSAFHLHAQTVEMYGSNLFAAFEDILVYLSNFSIVL